MRCPDCDPILAAGFTRCGQCGHTAYPADAEWLPGGAILAAYPAACEHGRPAAWLVDPAALTTSAQWCNAQTAATGAPCRNRARPGEPYCWQHGKGRARPDGAVR